MSNTKHTPGPWHFVIFNPQDRYEVYSESGSRTCVAKLNFNVPLTRNEEVLANAKLIAAAPELKRLLIGILRTGYHSTEFGNEAINLLLSIGEEL